MNSDNIKQKNEVDAELNQLLDHISNVSVPVHITKDGAWENLYVAISAQQENVDRDSYPFSKRTRLIFRYAAAAAIFICFCTYFFMRYFTTMDYIADSGRQVSFYLPDGSHVILNSESKISYKPYKWYQNRNIHLHGQAFFQVIKGSKFTVDCDKNTVTVLGTSFDVCSRNNHFKVECLTGKVKVNIALRKEEIITPGRAIDFSGDSISVYDFESQKGAAWTHGEFYFNKKDLSDVFQEMERQFNITIKYSKNSNRSYSGFFKTSSELNEALDMVCLPMKMKYRIVDHTTVVIEQE